MQWGEYRNNAHHFRTCEFHLQHDHDHYHHNPSLVYNHELFEHDHIHGHTARLCRVLQLRLPDTDPSELVGESRFSSPRGRVPR